MPVLSVVTRQLPALNSVAHKFGVQADLVDIDGDKAYVDLIGDNYKTLTVAIAAQATPLTVIDSIEHHERVKHYPTRPSY